MLMDIFSSFDPLQIKSNPFLFTPFIAFGLILFSPSMIHLGASANKVNLLVCKPIETQMKSTFFSTLTASTIFAPLFVILVALNILGLTPYLFSPTSHLTLSMSLALPLWLMLILSSACLSPKYFMASLLPEGAPLWLNPFLVLIEIMSTLFRPLTLAFRLAANITTGHIIMSLIASALSTLLLTSNALPLIIIHSAYFLFEFMICIIQAYIFCLLITLYANDHSH